MWLNVRRSTQHAAHRRRAAQNVRVLLEPPPLPVRLNFVSRHRVIELVARRSGGCKPFAPLTASQKTRLHADSMLETCHDNGIDIIGSHARFGALKTCFMTFLLPLCGTSVVINVYKNTVYCIGVYNSFLCTTVTD